MKPDPVLAHTIIPANPAEGQKHPHTFKVEGGLHYIRGNSAPHFTLTYTEHRQGFPDQEYSGGCNPELILQHFPQFADLAALHLSDINGVPMHAESNGWYQLTGALGGFGEKYHARDSKGNYPLPANKIDPVAPWRTTEHRLPTREECLAAFARHCRIGYEAARQIMAEVDLLGWRGSKQDKFSRARWAAICARMRPRWQAEANACILAHRLQVYGDPWGGPLPACLTAQPPAGEAMPRTCHDLLPGDTSTPLATEPDAEPTYIDRWGITSTAAKADSNPNMQDAAADMTHWRVTLHRGRARMTVYYSMGSAHAGRVPTAQEVIDCVAQDAASADGAESFVGWARDLGYDTDSRSAHRTYTICKRQGERLQKFLGAEHYAELMGGEE